MPWSGTKPEWLIVAVAAPPTAVRRASVDRQDFFQIFIRFIAVPLLASTAITAVNYYLVTNYE